MSKKLTIVEKFARITAIMNGEIEATKEDFDFIADRSALHSKKNASRKPTAKQTENEELKTAILDFLTENSDKKFYIGELMKKVPALAEIPDLQNQRVSALVGQLKKADLVIRTEEKGRAYFSIAE